MPGHQPKYIDSITMIALVLMVLSGAMALQHYMTSEPAAEVRFQTVRY
jgi:hypothetical protein